MYVIFEGIDCCGKSTQIDILSKKYSHFVMTKEPGNTELGKTLRDIILHDKMISKNAEFFLFLADRSEHYEKVIKPNSHKTIISDRGFVSGISYAFANDQNLDLDFLYKINKYALNFTLPQKIVFFEISKDELIKRMQNKLDDNIEKRGVKYLLEVQNVMKNVIEYINIPTLFINANDKIENITQKIEEFLK